MSKGSDDSASKSHEPTAEKLRKARQEGQIPRSNDLNTAVAYLGVFLSASVLGLGAIQASATALMVIVEQAGLVGPGVLKSEAKAILGPYIFASSLPFVAWFAVPGVFVLLCLAAQRAILVTPKNLMPKLSRIDPLANAKNKFGPNGLFEFLKSATKLMVYSVVAWFFLRSELDQLVSSIALEPSQITLLMGNVMKGMMINVLTVAFVIGAVDLLWQHVQHRKRNMMSLQEIKDETKDSEGDPQHKQHRRQRAQEIALNAMLADVPEADVIIVNPTHYSVALSWDRKSLEPPKCVAKGVDEIAAKIREIASEHGVPIHSDPPTARALHAALEVGDYIENDHFLAVAAAIRFADEMRRRARLM